MKIFGFIILSIKDYNERVMKSLMDFGCSGYALGYEKCKQGKPYDPIGDVKRKIHCDLVEIEYNRERKK